MQHYNAISTRSLEHKKDDLGAFTIPCIVWLVYFYKAVYDIDSSINLIPLSIYKKLGLGDPKPTTIRLLMDDRKTKRRIGILYDMIEKVDLFVFPVDFVIIDFVVDIEATIILGRQFLVTGCALVYMKKGQIKFYVE